MKKIKTLWDWMNERQRIYLNKKKGLPKPWTQDKIMQEYKFTNVFREQDRVTIELRDRIKRDESFVRQFWKTYVFRMFNRASTYDALLEAGLILTWNHKKASKLLKKLSANGQKIFTGAYIITNAGSTKPKIDVICEALTPMYKERRNVTRFIRECNSVEVAVRALSRFPNVGQFVGYEIATDLCHTPILEKAPDRMTWANPGPGAKRGLNRIYRGGPKHKATTPYYLIEMRDLLKEATHKVDPTIFYGKTRKFEMRDIEHSLCEYDKYMRVLKGEGRPRSKYDGKA